MANLYETVTARILSELEAGVIPWVKPWSATPGQNTPCNATTNRPYSGCNVVLLWLASAAGYATPRYLTYKQAQDAGGQVRKGERGVTVFFVSRIQVKDKSDGAKPNDKKTIPLLKAYTVFNVEQCDNLPDRVKTSGPVKVTNKDERDATIDEFLAHSGANIKEGLSEAFYRPSEDFVYLPAFITFRSAASFYATAFHELGHWTGHTSRLARDLKNRFGDKAYAAEELVAELCSAFLCAEFSVDGEIRHAGYIKNWIELLRDDSRAFFTAASKAQRAADYLRGVVLADA